MSILVRIIRIAGWTGRCLATVRVSPIAASLNGLLLSVTAALAGNPAAGCRYTGVGPRKGILI